ELQAQPQSLGSPWSSSDWLNRLFAKLFLTPLEAYKLLALITPELAWPPPSPAELVAPRHVTCLRPCPLATTAFVSLLSDCVNSAHLAHLAQFAASRTLPMPISRTLRASPSFANFAHFAIFALFALLANFAHFVHLAHLARFAASRTLLISRTLHTSRTSRTSR